MNHETTNTSNAMKKITVLLVMLVFVLGGVAWGEDHYKDQLALQKDAQLLPLQQVDLLELPDLDVEKALAEDAEKKTSSPDKSGYRIGLASEMKVNTGSPDLYTLNSPQGESRGTWEELPDGNYLWRLRVKSSGALGLSFGFTSYSMPDKARLSVYSIDRARRVGPYTVKDNNINGQLWTPIIPGEEAVLELTIPGESIETLTLILGSVSHIYRGISGSENSDACNRGDKAGSCNVDVACNNQWASKQIRSVGRYSYTKNGSSYVCTGSLINNTRNDGKPYFLTAHHCVSSSSVAATVVVTWDYQSRTCRSPGSWESGSPLPLSGASQSGAILRATYGPSDFTLLELSNSPEPTTDAFWSGWDRTGGNPTFGVCIHHPRGHAKRISNSGTAPISVTSYLGGESPGDGTHFRVDHWDEGTTEGGSSGSGLWDSNKRLVGQLHGGGAACDNNDPDWFGRLADSWEGGGSSATRLKDWLAPGSGEGPTVLSGYEGRGTTTAITLQNFQGLTLPSNDDQSTGRIALGFPVKFFDRWYTSVFVNNNGNVTFDAPQRTFTPYSLTSTTRKIIAPFFADVDTRNSSNVKYGRGVMNGAKAFGVNWFNVGYFYKHGSPRNSFQLIFVDRRDIRVGDFDIIFSYQRIKWETGDASGGTGGFGGHSARVGFSNGTGQPGTFYEMQGSAINGSFIDGGPHALTSGKYNSNQLGHYVFKVRKGRVGKPTSLPWLLLLSN